MIESFTKNPFSYVFAATFLFNRDFILFGYKTECNFHA